VPFLLTLAPATATLAEGQNGSFTVTRNGSRTASLSVNLISSDTSELTVPANVTIPAGAASASFSASAQSDGLFDGAQSAQFTASANGFSNGLAMVSVNDVDVPRLFLTLSTNRALEGSSVGAVVTRELVTAGSLAVTLSGGDGQLAFPGLVTIPANTNSVAFNVTALGDTLVEPTNTHSFTASAAGFQSAMASLSIEDDDLPNVTITLALQTVGEDTGANATTATVTRDRNSPRALSLTLSCSDTNTARVPALVTIPASQTNVTFPVAVVNNSNVDGTRMVTIGGVILSSVGGIQSSLVARRSRTALLQASLPTLKSAISSSTCAPRTI
jgi:hypothetical protein